MYGAGGQKRVPESFFKDFRAGLPPLNEQQAIARFLDYKTAQIDALINAIGGGGGTNFEKNEKKRNMVTLLQEYRSSLITNAVTGKIDVRHATIPSNGDRHDW